MITITIMTSHEALRYGLLSKCNLLLTIVLELMGNMLTKAAIYLCTLQTCIAAQHIRSGKVSITTKQYNGGVCQS